MRFFNRIDDKDRILQAPSPKSPPYNPIGLGTPNINPNYPPYGSPSSKFSVGDVVDFWGTDKIQGEWVTYGEGNGYESSGVIKAINYHHDSYWYDVLTRDSVDANIIEKLVKAQEHD